jgi:hypothetical protein
MSPYKSLAPPDDLKADAAQKRRFSVQLLDQDLGTGKARLCRVSCCGGGAAACAVWVLGSTQEFDPHSVLTHVLPNTVFVLP